MTTTEYEATLIGGEYDGLKIRFDINKTPSALKLDKHQYYRRIKKKDTDGPWEPSNLEITFVQA